MLRVTANPFIFHTFQEKSCGLHTRLAMVNHRCPFPYFCLRGGRRARQGGVCTQANTSPVCEVLLWKKLIPSRQRTKQRKKRPTLFRVAHSHVFALTVQKLLVSAYGCCRRDVKEKYKTTTDFVVLVEVLAFSL